MEKRQRIRDLTYDGKRWIASVVAVEEEGGIWRGRLVYFLDTRAPSVRVEDTLALEALAFPEAVAQAAALSVDEMCARLARLLAGEGEGAEARGR